ncbi:hypothetical protein [Streptomyces longispororuber]|uniref:hypothetical protein n=1 Tax=Streptomyces longispororuber TaxID=68230 RepID=UPI00370002C7
MSRQNDEYRTIAYWPSKDERRVFAVERSPEVDAMTDRELIDAMTDEELSEREVEIEESPMQTRVVSHDRDDGGRTIIVLARTTETDKLTDEEILARAEAYERGRRHLRSVDDAE